MNVRPDNALTHGCHLWKRRQGPEADPPLEERHASGERPFRRLVPPNATLGFLELGRSMLNFVIFTSPFRSFNPAQERQEPHPSTAAKI